jgi:glutamine synthetase type III
MQCASGDQQVGAYGPPANSLVAGETPGKNFGSNVFTKAEMRARLPKQVYKSVVATIEKGTKLDTAVADPSALQAVSAPLAELTDALAALKTALCDHSAESPMDEAKHAQQALLPATDAVRTAADTLESVVAEDLWPLPTYQEMLYIR